MKSSKLILMQAVILSLFVGMNAFSAPSQKELKYVYKGSSYDKLPPAKKGGTVILELLGNPKVFNPVISDSSDAFKMEGYLFSNLMTEDAETLEVLPSIATGYTVSADKKDYTFFINKDAKWEDGTPVTAHDFKFTHDKVMDTKVNAAPKRAYLQGVTAEVINDLTIKYHVDTPKFDTLRSLYLQTAVQKKQFENEPDFNKAKGIMAPIGNGPYRLKQFSRDQKVEFERIKNYWGDKLPYAKNIENADTVIFKIVGDASLRYEKFLKGEIDIMDFQGPNLEAYVNKARGIDKDKVGTKPNSGKDVWANHFENSAPRGYSYVGWNLKKPVFKSKLTRQALARLIDYKTISDKIFFGFYYQSTSPFGSRTMNSDQSLRSPSKMLTFDTKKAMEMLKKDGWADTDGNNILDKMIDGQKVEFKFTIKSNSNNPARAKIAQIIKENYKKAGIEVTINMMEWNAFLGDMDKRNFDACILGWTATPYPNPAQTWHTDAEKDEGSNFISYSNPKVDELITKANMIFDLKARAKVLQEINRILYDDQPYAFLLEPGHAYAGFNKKVKASVWIQKYAADPQPGIYSYVSP